MVDLDIQAHPVASIHLELLVDKNLDKGLASHMIGSPEEVGLVDSLHMLVVPAAEEFGFRKTEGAEIVNCCIHNLGSCRAMPATQLWEMERDSS